MKISIYTLVALGFVLMIGVAAAEPTWGVCSYPYQSTQQGNVVGFDNPGENGCSWEADVCVAVLQFGQGVGDC